MKSFEQKDYELKLKQFDREGKFWHKNMGPMASFSTGMASVIVAGIVAFITWNNNKQLRIDRTQDRERLEYQLGVQAREAKRDRDAESIRINNQRLADFIAHNSPILFGPESDAKKALLELILLSYPGESTGPLFERVRGAEKSAQLKTAATQAKELQLDEFKKRGPPFGYRIKEQPDYIWTNFNGKRIHVVDAKGIAGELGVNIEELGSSVERDDKFVYNAGEIVPH